MKLKRLLILSPVLLLLFWPTFKGLQAQTGKSSTATLTWTAGTGDVTYNVYRGTASGGPYTQIATGVTVTTYADSTGAAGTKYFYVVTGAAPGFLESPFSNEASATFFPQAGAPGSLAVTVK